MHILHAMLHGCTHITNASYDHLYKIDFEYSKHPRIRTHIFASKPELVLIFWVFRKKSLFFIIQRMSTMAVFSQTLV